jgi:hypothetical protein
MKLAISTLLAVFACALLVALLILRDVDRRLDALERRLAAPAPAAAVVDPYADTPAARALRLERVYQAAREGREAAAYVKARDAAASQVPVPTRQSPPR